MILHVIFHITIYLIMTPYSKINVHHNFGQNTATVFKVELLEQKRNVMAHAQKPDLVFQRNGRVHLYRRGCQFSQLLAAEVCASAVVMLDRPCPIQCTTAG